MDLPSLYSRKKRKSEKRTGNIEFNAVPKSLVLRSVLDVMQLCSQSITFKFFGLCQRKQPVPFRDGGACDVNSVVRRGRLSYSVPVSVSSTCSHRTERQPRSRALAAPSFPLPSTSLSCGPLLSCETLRRHGTVNHGFRHKSRTEVRHELVVTSHQ